MLPRANCLFLRYSAAICLVGLTVMPAMAAEPKVYRCGPEGSQWYSQIPCEENSEEIIVEDHAMFSETNAVESQTAAIAGSDATEPAADEEDASAKAQAFIDQLEKQRSAQLADLDGRIEALESQVAAANEGTDDGAGVSGETESNAEQQEAMQQLATLKKNRQSMVSEYEAMISAARQRIDTP